MDGVHSLNSIKEFVSVFSIACATLLWCVPAAFLLYQRDLTIVTAWIANGRAVAFLQPVGGTLRLWISGWSGSAAGASEGKVMSPTSSCVWSF